MTAQELNFSNFFETTADGNIGASDTSITLSAAPTSDGTSAITGPFYLVIDPDSLTKREVVLVSSISGVIATVTRDVEGRHTTDPSHSDGTTIRMAVVGEMFTDVNDRLNDVALTGDVTGTLASATQDIDTTLNLNNLTGETVDVSADSIAFIDASDSNNSKKESVADFVSGIAGSGLTASNGQLTAGAGFELNSAKAFFALNG